MKFSVYLLRQNRNLRIGYERYYIGMILGKL